MSDKLVVISEAESRVMELLWQQSPQTSEEIVAALLEPTGCRLDERYCAAHGNIDGSEQRQRCRFRTPEFLHLDNAVRRWT